MLPRTKISVENQEKPSTVPLWALPVPCFFKDENGDIGFVVSGAYEKSSGLKIFGVYVESGCHIMDGDKKVTMVKEAIITLK